MAEKTTIRSTDRDKVKKHYQVIEDHFRREFNSGVYCNRCKKQLSLELLEIHHLTYEDDSYRYGELVCNLCHVNIERGDLPSFEEIKNIAPQTILIFQKYLSGISIISKSADGRVVQSSKLKLRPYERLNPLLLLGIFNKNP